MGKNRIVYLCALLGCFGFYIAYREWLSWLLLVGALGLPWLSLLVSIPMIRSFRIRLDVPEVLRMGDQRTLDLVPGAWPATPPYSGRIRLESSLSGQSLPCKPGAPVPTEHCGAIRVKPEKLFVHDALGLFRFRVKHREQARILVRPVPVAMDQVPDLSRYLAGAWRPKPGGGYAENHELRLYRPGDSLNQIHWKLTAKTGKLMLREPMEPDRGLALLTLDLNGTPQELDRKLGRLLWLGDRLLEQGIPFRIRALTGQGLVEFPVRKGYQLRRSLDSLLDSSPAQEGSVLDRQLRAPWHCHLGGEPHEP